MTWQTRIVLIAAAHLVFCTGVQAQPVFTTEGTARWWWRGSIDGGTTWQTERLSLDHGDRDVLLEAWCEYPRLTPQTYFGQVSVELVVTSQGTSTISDRFDTSSARQGRDFVGIAPVQNYLFGNRLKLDAIDDATPPGERPGGIFLAQSSPPGIEIVNYDNPVRTFQCTLRLGEDTGLRSLETVFRPWLPPFTDGRRYIQTWNYPDSNSLNLPSLIQDPFVIDVVPAPGTVLLLSLSFLATRPDRLRHRGDT
jgi:hypothetical protein